MNVNKSFHCTGTPGDGGTVWEIILSEAGHPASVTPTQNNGKPSMRFPW